MALEVMSRTIRGGDFLVPYREGHVPFVPRWPVRDYTYVSTQRVANEIGHWEERATDPSLQNEFVAEMRRALSYGFAALKSLELGLYHDRKEITEPYQRCLSALGASCFMRQTPIGDALVQSKDIGEACDNGITWDPLRVNRHFRLHLTLERADQAVPVPDKRPHHIWHKGEGILTKSVYPALPTNGLQLTFNKFFGGMPLGEYVTLDTFLAKDFLS